MSQKIVLIGAGSANFGLEAVSDIYKSKTLEGSEIVLHDTNQEALKETQEVADKYKENGALILMYPLSQIEKMH